MSISTNTVSFSEIEDFFSDLKKRRIMTVPYTKVQGKSLEKMVYKMVTNFAISFDNAPNLTNRRQQSSLRHMAFRHFMDGLVTEETYMDYIYVSKPTRLCFSLVVL